MKRLLIVLPFLISTLLIHAQPCNKVAESKIKRIEEAAYNPQNRNERAYDSLRKEVSELFTILENCAVQNPSYETHSKAKKLGTYFIMAELAGLIHKYPEMLKNIEAMERILPSPGYLSSSAIKSYTIAGNKYTFDAPNSYINGLYYKIIEYRVNYYYFGLRDNNKVIEHYRKMDNAPSDFKPASLEALLYADALYKTGKSPAEYFPAMAKSSILFGEQWSKKEEHDSVNIRNRSLMLNWLKREMNYYKSNFNTSDPDGKWRMMAARGLWASDEKDLAKDYALSASEAGYANLNDGYWYLDIVANGEEKHDVGALKIIERLVYALSESQMNQILPLAQKYHMTSLEEAIKARLKKLNNQRRRSTVTFYPAVELIGLPCKHIPVSLNLRTGRVIQEFRFDYVWGAVSRYRFGRIFDKGEKGSRYRFTGWDVGYSLNYIVGKEFRQGNKKNGRSTFFAPSLGLDFRFANWNLDPMTTNVLNENGGITESNVRIDATTNRYEACYRVSLITMTRFVTIDYYFGVGVGYRSLKTAQGRDVESEFFQDARLDKDRWNKVYMPLRLGLKIGLNIL